MFQNLRPKPYGGMFLWHFGTKTYVLKTNSSKNNQILEHKLALINYNVPKRLRQGSVTNAFGTQTG